MSHKDYYTVLGVAEDAGQKAIKNAHRGLAKKYHPDTNRGDKGAEDRFKEIQEAYDVLGDAGKRKKYDELRRLGAVGGGGFGGEGFNFEDLFGGGGQASAGGFGGSLFDLFERAGMGRRHASTPQRGDDLNAEVTVDFETAAFGGATTIRLNRVERCGTCDGGGAAPGSRPETCPVCSGTGSTSMSQGGFAVSRPCSRCMGRGQVVSKPCPSCGGSGSRTLPRDIEVKIPAGVGDGAKIRLRGEGEAGDPGAPSGDLILTVRVRGHTSFRRDGLDVHSELRLDMATAALGTVVEVETLNGPVKLKVPGGVQPNAKLRLKGRGVTDHKGRSGHHYVRMRVEVPKQLTERQRKLLEEFVESGEGEE